jgi:hypothetical protein
MTALKGTQAMLLIDEFNFSGNTSGFGVDVAMSEEECTDLESLASEYEPILPMMTIGQNGYIAELNDDGALEKELNRRLGVAGSHIAALLGIASMGCPGYVLEGTYGSSMTISAPATGLMTLEGAWGKGRGGHRGIRIWTGELSSIGTQAAIDLGSAGSDGGQAFLFVQAITGTATNADVLVESSATEGGAYLTEATFTFSAVGSAKQDMSGTVNQWLRANLSDLGGATAVTFVLIVCVNGVTQ